MPDKISIAFLASHNGSSARAITQACLSGKLAATPTLLISNNPESKALDWAEDAGLKALVINASTHSDVDSAIAAALEGHQIDLLCCSGYMKLIGPQTIAAMNGKIWNVHPALLPNYGGKGMYGKFVHEAVAASGDVQTGITIHEVDGEYDRGRIIAQKIISLSDTDTAETIEQKVKEAEPDFYIETLASYLSTLNQTA